MSYDVAIYALAPGQRHGRGVYVAPGSPSEILGSDILKGGVALDGATGVDTSLDITIVPEGTPVRVVWYVDGVLFRDDDYDPEYSLQYNSSAFPVNTVVTAPSGNTFEFLTDGSSYTFRADVEYASQTVSSLATFTTVDDGSTSEPGNPGPDPGGGVGDYDQQPFTVSLTTGGSVAFDPANYPLDLIFPRSYTHVGLAGVGVSRGSLSTVGGFTISAASQPGNPPGSGTLNDPWVYSLQRIDGTVVLDGDAGEFWVEFDRVWNSASGDYSFWNPSSTYTVHAKVYDSDVTPSSSSTIVGNSNFMSIDDLTVQRVYAEGGADVFKLSDLTLVEDSYLVVRHPEGGHTDVMQIGDNRIGKATIRRCWMQGQSGFGGSIHYGNSGLQCKPDDDGPIQFTFEDCMIQARNYGIYRNGNADPDSYFVTRRNIIAPTLDGSSSTWNASALRSGLSPKSAGPDRTTRSSTDDYHIDGTLLPQSAT